MQAIDDATGIVDPATKRKAEAEFKRQQERGTPPPVPNISAGPNGALDDQSLAMNMLAQAKRMESEAEGMIKEAARMKKEAERMHPGVVPGTSDASAKPVATKSTRGRPKKAVAENAVE
jgi:hypothetical protein